MQKGQNEHQSFLLISLSQQKVTVKNGKLKSTISHHCTLYNKASVDKLCAKTVDIVTDVPILALPCCLNNQVEAQASNKNAHSLWSLLDLFVDDHHFWVCQFVEAACEFGKVHYHLDSVSIDAV